MHNWEQKPIPVRLIQIYMDRTGFRVFPPLPIFNIHNNRTYVRSICVIRMDACDNVNLPFNFVLVGNSWSCVSCRENPIIHQWRLPSWDKIAARARAGNPDQDHGRDK